MFLEFLRVLQVLSVPCAGLQGSRPMSRLGASCHLSPDSVTRQSKHAEHLGCDEAVIPCLQLLAGRALRHARPGLGAFPQQWHRGRASLSRGARWLPCRALSLRCWPAAPLVSPPEDCSPSHLTFLSLGSQSRQHLCYLPSAW